MNDCELRIVDLGNSRELDEVSRFLAQFDLSYDGDVDYTVVLYRRGEMAATGSFAGKILRNMAVAKELQGEGLLSLVVSALLQEQSRRGIYHSFVYTRPERAYLFENLGFSAIVKAEPYAAVLEFGIGSVEKYCGRVAKAIAALPPGRTASLVMNCNPFTLGHKAVIGRAAAENDRVIVFVVSEDRSLFPFADRIQLVREGVAEFANVVVVPGEDYIISAATFPAYFTRAENLVTAQTRLDATLFATRIAPSLSITRRYVGEEPYCPVTRAYNQALLEILPANGVEVIVMPRVASEGAAISASHVRDLIRVADWPAVKRLVPETTYRYLTSPAAKPVLENIRGSQSRH